jgi:hypothetical protein
VCGLIGYAILRSASHLAGVFEGILPGWLGGLPPPPAWVKKAKKTRKNLLTPGIF